MVFFKRVIQQHFPSLPAKLSAAAPENFRQSLDTWIDFLIFARRQHPSHISRDQIQPMRNLSHTQLKRSALYMKMQKLTQTVAESQATTSSQAQLSALHRQMQKITQTVAESLPASTREELLRQARTSSQAQLLALHGQMQKLTQTVANSLPASTREELLSQAAKSLKQQLRVDEARIFLQEQSEIHSMLNNELHKLRKVVEHSSSASSSLSSSPSFTVDPLNIAAIYDKHEKNKLDRWAAWRNTNNIDAQNVGSQSVLGSKLEKYLHFASAVYKDDVIAALQTREQTDKRWCVLHHSNQALPGRPAHSLMIDEECKRVVLAIRGTSTLADGLTDIIATIVPYDPWFSKSKDATGDDDVSISKQHTAHSGFAHAAANVLSSVESKLVQVLNDHNIEELSIVGHSLGAGTASLAAIELAARFPYLVKKQTPVLHCYAYACPPSMSSSLSQKCEHFVTSVVHSDDVIPSASLHSFVDLFNDVSNIDTLAFTVDMAENLLQIFTSGNLDKDWLVEQIRIRLQEDTRTLEKHFENPKNDWIRPEAAPLYPAGRVIHLVKDPIDVDSEGYVAIELKEKESRERFGSIQLSSTMLSDHSLVEYLKSIRISFNI